MKYIKIIYKIIIDMLSMKNVLKEFSDNLNNNYGILHIISLLKKIILIILLVENI